MKKSRGQSSHFNLNVFNKVQMFCMTQALPHISSFTCVLCVVINRQNQARKVLKQQSTKCSDTKTPQTVCCLSNRINLCAKKMWLSVFFFEHMRQGVREEVCIEPMWLHVFFLWRFPVCYCLHACRHIYLSCRPPQ